MKFVFTLVAAAVGAAVVMSGTCASALPLSQAPAAEHAPLAATVQYRGNCFYDRFGRFVCRAPRYYAPRYDLPPRRDPYQNRCAVVYNQCYPYGRHSPAYNACMRRGGCG